MSNPQVPGELQLGARRSLLTAVFMLLTACGGGGGGSSAPPPNRPPTAIAGPDQPVRESSTVTLQGSGFDPDGGVLEYLWSQVSGPTVTFSDTSIANPTIDVPESPAFGLEPVVLSLRVTDPDGASASDEVTLDLTSREAVVFIGRDSSGSQNDELYRYSPASEALFVISAPLAGDDDVFDFKISPDGTRVAYRARKDPTNALYVAAIDGSDAIQVSGAMIMTGAVIEYAWSPDSSSLAYTADADVDRFDEVFVVSADGTDLRRVNADIGTPARFLYRRITWSPDSRYLASFVLDTSTSDVVAIEVHDIASVMANAVRINPPLVDGGEVKNFQWSPDSSLVAYVADQETFEVDEIYVVRPDGTANRKINGALQPNRGAGNFSWSPDASRIAYRSYEESDQLELYVIDADGSDRTRVNGSLLPGGLVGDFRWSPDGSWIAYRARQLSNRLELYTVRPDGSQNSRVGTAPTVDDAVSQFENLDQPWSNTSIYLAYVAFTAADNSFEVFAVRPDGSDNLRLSQALMDGLIVMDYAWSPVGDRIVYNARLAGSGSSNLYTVRPDGTDSIAVTNFSSGTLSAYLWAEDGSAIAYVADEALGTGRAVFLASPDGVVNISVTGEAFGFGDIDEIAWAVDRTP